VALKEARHALLTQEPGYQGQRVDVADVANLEKVFAAQRPSLVCHLAAQAGVRYSITNPHAYQKSNLEGFLNVLELCRRYKVARLVYASSSSVYGGNTKLPFAESDPVETPISLYAATKRSNELMAHSYAHLYGFQTVGLRFFTVYGPYGRPDMAMWLFTEAILAGKPIKIFNHGDMQRDFTFVDDIVAGVVASLTRPNFPPCTVINLGNHRAEALLDMIDHIERACGKKAERQLVPLEPGDVKATFADIRRAQELLGFAPTTPIAVGIPKFIEWYLSDKNPLRKQ
jgi:UDP-glucuronate 4-epimerase